MRRSKAEVERYISSVQSSSPSLKEKPIKGFLFAKLYFEAKEYELAKRHVSEYLKVQERDPKAHKFLGQLYEKEGEVDKAVGCYKRSVDLNPAQKDLVLKVAELLCGKEQSDSRAEFWVEKAAKLLPGNPAIFNLKEQLLSHQGQQGWNRLFDLLQAELAVRPADVHVNIKLVELYTKDGRLDEAVKCCLTSENRSQLRNSLDWYSVVVQTLQDYLSQPAVANNEKMCRRLKRELLLADCNLLRLKLSVSGVQPALDALRSFDEAMQSVSTMVGSQPDELCEVYGEMRGHLYLHAGTLLLKMALEREQHWRAVSDLATLCFLLSYQVPRPKTKVTKGDQAAPQLLQLLASDRQSQAGHMLLNLGPTDTHTFISEVVEAFGSASGQGSLFELLFGPHASTEASFIANDDIRSINTHVPELSQLAKWDNGSILLHGGDLQHLNWLGLQWTLLSQKAAVRDWIKQLFPRLTLETSKLDTNAPESICLLDLEVFVCGVVFCCHCQLQEKAKINSVAKQPHNEPRCLPLPLLPLLSSERQREWWDAVYCLIHKQALPGVSAKLRIIVQHGLSTLRAGEKHGLQPALAIHWAQHLSHVGMAVNSYYDQKEYIGRSVHYWKAVLPLLEKIRSRQNIPEPLDPLFIHFPIRDIQISIVKEYEEEAMIGFASLLDIEGKTEEAIATLETINNVSSTWHLAQIYQRLSEEAGNGVEETQDRCIMFLRKFRTHLSKIFNADDIEQLPVPMEEVMDLLKEVNQQLEELGEDPEEEEKEKGLAPRGPSRSTPETNKVTISRINFSTTSPNKSMVSPSKIHLISPKTPPHWVEDQKSILQMLCQQVEALKNEVHDLKQNSTGTMGSPYHRMYGESYGAEGLQEPYTPVQPFHGAPLSDTSTGPSMYYNQSPAYNSQYLLRTSVNVTPTKGPMYSMNRMPPQQYSYQQPTHTPPLQAAPAGVYPPQEQVFGAPLRFESPATNLLSPYSEEYYSHGVTQPTTSLPLPEPGYFTKPTIAPVQPPKSTDGKPVDLGKISSGQLVPPEIPKVPTFVSGPASQSTTSAAFQFNSNFKSNDGDFTFPASQAKHSESLLGLLTSDISTKSDGLMAEQKPVAQDQAPSQTAIFTFGSKSTTGFSFAGSTQNTATPILFEKVEKPFNFGDITKPIVGMVKCAEAEQPQPVESDNDSTHAEDDEDGPHFEPIVPLPDKIDVKTGEEEEQELFCNRAKLFRFETETKEWKERGIGNVKILKHKTSGKVRLLMRREQVLKICANHYINADMLLKPNAGSDKSWVWNAIDFADEQQKPEQLAIRFKTAEEAALFKTKFEEAQKHLPKSPVKHDQLEKREMTSKLNETPTTPFGAQFALKEGEWECSVCCVTNKATDVQCVACQTKNPNGSSKPEGKTTSESKSPHEKRTGASGFTFKFGTNSSKKSSGIPFAGFGAFGAFPTSFSFGTGSSTPSDTVTSAIETQFMKKPGQWDCDTCAVRNEASSKSCVSCQTPNASAESITTAPSQTACPPTQTATTTSTKPSSAAFGSNFNIQFMKKPGQWDCDTCAVRNEASSKSCVSCQTPNASAESITTAPSQTAGPSVQTTAVPSSKPSSAPFSSQFMKKPGQWDCDTCAVRNEASSKSCVACQTPNASAESITTAPSQTTTTTSTKPSSAAFGSNFGIQFMKKPGQWDCDTCAVRNEASSKSCVSCQTPNASAESITTAPSQTACPPTQTATTTSTKPSSAAFGSNFGIQFMKKPGQWDCDTCAVRNEASSKSCVSCQTPNASAESITTAPSQTACPPTQTATTTSTKPSSAAFGSNFGIQFMKKPGQWDCDTCAVRNEASSKSCVSCQTPNASAESITTAPSQTAGPSVQTTAVPSSKPSSAPFSSQFMKKPGQWDCDTCAVRNEASSTTCVACQSPIPLPKTAFPTPAADTKASNSGFGDPLGKQSQQWKCDKCSVKNDPSVTKCISCQAPYATLTLGAMFAKKDGEWDCDTCLVRNDASANQCLSCHAPNPTDKSTTDLPPSASSLCSSTFSFNFGDKSTLSQSSGTAFTARFGNSSTQLCPNKDSPSASSFKFGAPQSGPSITSASSFSFSLPIQDGGFKFGAQETAKDNSVIETQTHAPVSASTVLKSLADQHKEKEKGSTPPMGGTDQDQNPLFTGKPNTFSFADLASEDFEFGQKDPDFKGFSRAGEQLFSSYQGTPSKADVSGNQEEEDMYKTEENDDIQFEPVVQMPEKVDLVTGEENEQVLYSQRVKLFRFDTSSSQWKERGLGILKFLKNATNGRLRVLMRREQVLKVCANHWITTTMNLKPLAGSDKAWMWMANDFSDGDAKLEQLAAKFKTPELAQEFKQNFEECQRLLLDIALQTPHKLVDTGRTARLIQKAEEMKSGLKDLKSFLTDDKTKLTDNVCQAGVAASSSLTGLAVKPHTESMGPVLEWDNYDLRGEPLDDSADTSVYASPLASSPIRKNLFRFGESTGGFSFSFQPGISPAKSPAKLNQSGASVGTVDEQDSTQDSDSQYFEPIVPLPDLVEISTGEENEQVVFSHRAKLYRYDKDVSQWKERGIGDIKILQNFDSRRVRLIMRRDQVLKICANHWITMSMKLDAMKGAEKAWVWSALDFVDVKDGQVEQLAVRFKLLDVANTFKEVFEKAKNAQESETLLTPVTSRVSTPPQDTVVLASMTTTTPVCGKAAIAILEETTKESTDLTLDDQPSTAVTHSLSNPTKIVVSPPKFVFGTDTLQKIFGTLTASPEPDNSSPSSRTKDNSHPSQPASVSPTFKTQEKALPDAEGGVEVCDSEVEVVYVREPSTEQASLARSLLLPLTFFCYQNEAGYTSDDHTDDEDYESAVKALEGKLYPGPPERGGAPNSTSPEPPERGAPNSTSPEPPERGGAPNSTSPEPPERGAPNSTSPEPPERGAAPNAEAASDADCQVVWEKTPTPEEEEKAKTLLLPPTFFCDLGTSDTEADKPEEFEAELRKAQEALNAQLNPAEGTASTTAPETLPNSSQVSSTTYAAASSLLQGEPNSALASEAQNEVPSNGCPIDLSTRKSQESDSTDDAATTATASTVDLSFGFSALEGFSFADLANNTEEYAFGKKDSNFSWANAGASVFGQAVSSAPKKDGEEEGSEEEATDNADIHFEPIVSLPEVETKSGEEDEEILFKERTKLYRWDRQLGQWKERGVGDIKILYHPTKRLYRILMRREQVLRVCANHNILPSMELNPMNTSANALVWTATDHAEGSASVEQLAVKFKNADLAEKFKKTFWECQQRLGQPSHDGSSQQMSRAQEHSRTTNPVVFLTIAADDQTLGTVTVELFSHVVPKTAENFRVLCTGEKGFGLRDSIFHRVIPNFMCQGGDITNQDGTGGKSIYGGKFEDENFDVRHTGPGLLSMANHGRDTNSSQFFITLKKAEHLDFKHVTFGWVRDGMEVVRLMGELGSASGKPSKRISITDCGQL